jgi:hypothetical protein
VAVLSGESYELLTDVIKMLMEWEQDYRNMPDNSKEVINRLNGYLVHHTKALPSRNLREFIEQLKTISVHEMGFDLEEQYGSLQILNEEGRINSELKYWYENSLQNDDVDQNLVKEFLFSCREEYKLTQDQRIMDMYSEVRAFINPSNYCITADRIMNLIGKYSNVSDSIIKVRDWYENISLKTKENYSCPVCGKILSNDIFSEYRCTDMCMYYRDKDTMQIMKFNADETLKYKKLKRGIYTYTLIPGVSELRIYKELLERFDDNVKITLYPKIDKFDISIDTGEGCIYLDVKDFASPHDLVESLIQNQSFIKMNGVNEEDFVYLVIPEHRKYLYKGGNYRNVIRKKLQDLTDRVRVVYENEIYREVGDIINELY